MASRSPARSRAFDIADSVRDVVELSHPLAAHSMDRRRPITADLVDEVINQSCFGWEGRSPRPALDAWGNFQCTDLDLGSFLIGVVPRGPILELPTYENRRGLVTKVNERKIGISSFGKLRGLISNQDVFSFSVQMFDQSIAVERDGVEEMGATFNYMLVDVTGEWHDGWKELSWKPDAAENKFLTQKGLWTGNSVVFKNFVHPNRWQSFYGAPYLLLKMLLARINDEASYCRSEVKRLSKAGISLPPSEYTPPASTGETVSMTVQTLEAEIDLPDLIGEYDLPQGDTLVRATAAHERQKFLTYKLRPRAQFVVRADELAFFKYGENRKASWAKNTPVEVDYRMPKGKIDWTRIRLSNEVAIRYRTHEKTERVAA